MGDAGADSPPWQPASQESKLHASAPPWVFCPNFTLIEDQSGAKLKNAPRNVALYSTSDPFWCVQNLPYINWLNLEQFPL
ncbi:hypothetical protein FQ185_06295 [Pseudomonas sp. ANT_H12B]|nr:hypothetical protein FQ185_06295 [Pseudomonas sp. ANT_H12B]